MEISLTHSFTHLLTTWKQEMLAHLKIHLSPCIFLARGVGGGTPYVTLEIHGYADTDF